MKKEDFADVIGDISQKYILKAGAESTGKNTGWHKWVAVAACFCLIAAAAALASGLFPRNTPNPPDGGNLSIHQHPVQTAPTPSTESQHTQPSRTPWTIHYNQVFSQIAANRAYIKGTFTESLSDAELTALMPSGELNCTGYARFDNYGNLLDITLEAATTLPECPVTVGIADYWFGFDYVLSGGETLSICNELEYKAYEYKTDDSVFLSAYTIINDLYFGFSMDAPLRDLAQAKTDFQYVLECFAYYENGKPNISNIAPEEIPELMEQMFTSLSEAQTEKDFGGFMPSELPDGFGESTIYRFRFQNTNFLSALWSRGLDDLSWVVKPYVGDDAHRITSVKDKENYDLSLYPIPRAESVPDELHDIVDDPIFEAEELTLEAVYCRAYKVEDAGDSDGWRMRFSVKYGDVIVSINSKGVDPAWLFAQLMLLK